MLDNWHERFPNCEPVSHWMRTAFRDRWVRFHSLPESKRYPEDESEYQIALQRHNCILWELLEGERDVVLLTTGYSETPEPVRSYDELSTLDPNAKPWQTIAKHNVSSDFADPTYWHVFASALEWESSLFNPLIRLVADDVVANVMVVHPECRWLLHPYDGGMDVIAETPAAKGRLRAAHKDWLSALASGM